MKFGASFPTTNTKLDILTGTGVNAALNGLCGLRIRPRLCSAAPGAWSRDREAVHAADRASADLTYGKSPDTAETAQAALALGVSAIVIKADSADPEKVRGAVVKLRAA